MFELEIKPIKYPKYGQLRTTSFILMLEKFMSFKTTKYITHFKSMFHLYISWKHKKISGFLMFSGVIEIEHYLKMG